MFLHSNKIGAFGSNGGDMLILRMLRQGATGCALPMHVPGDEPEERLQNM
jgi:hypothetical protein